MDIYIQADTHIEKLSRMLFFLKKLPLPPPQQVTATVETNTRPIIPRCIHKKTPSSSAIEEYVHNLSVHTISVAPNVVDNGSKRYGDELFEMVNQFGDAEICGLQDRAVTVAGSNSAGVTI